MASSSSTPQRPRSGASARPQPVKSDPVSAWLNSIPATFRSPACIGLILIAVVIFFNKVIFGGMVFEANDNISWQSFLPYLNSVSAKGELPFWIPNIFSGMPGFGALLVTGDRWWDLTMTVIGIGEKTFSAIGHEFYTTRVILYYIFYGAGMYTLMRARRVERGVALFTALAAIFSTWIIIYAMIGHNTKIMVLASFPWILLCMEKLIERWSFLYAGLLVAAVHVASESGHPQTLFYGACAFGIFLLFELINGIVTKQRNVSTGVVRAAAIALLAGAITYGTGIDRYSAVAEYTPYSTRGAGPMRTSAKDKETSDGGHGYQYATDWSFSPQEVITYLNPNYFGFGWTTVEDAKQGIQKTSANTYWGQMPFTDAGHYVGAGVLLLGLLGFVRNRRDRFAQALMVIGLFGLFLSFGRNSFGFIYDFFYNYVPSFNKLRAPSQSLVLLEFALPILAGLGLQSIINARRAHANDAAVMKREERSMRNWTFGWIGVILFGLLAVTLMKSSYIEGIGQKQQELASIAGIIYSKMIEDWVWSLVCGGATIALAWLYMRGKIASTLLTVAVILVAMIDLWRVDYRPLKTIPKQEAFAAFESTDTDDFLKKDSSLYRILDATVPANYPARKGYEHVMGYHAAKMRSYQNFLDYTDRTKPDSLTGNLPTTPLAWNILNMKYTIANGLIDPTLKPVFQSQMRRGVIVSENPNVLPRAWFVNRVEVASDSAVLTMIGDTSYRATGKQSFDPREVAWLHEALKTKIDPVGYTPGTTAPLPMPGDSVADSARPSGAPMNPGRGTVAFTRHEEHHIEMKVNAPGPGNNFLVVSEVHFPPGWRAAIDGKPTDIVQTNYLLRGVVVPAGNHTVTMEYVREGFETQRMISLVLNIIILGSIALGGYIEWRSRKRMDPAPPITSTES